MPGRLELDQAPPGASKSPVSGEGRGDALDRLGGVLVDDRGPAPESPVASMIASTSRCPHSGATSSSRRPVNRFSTPPGKSETPATSPRSRQGSGETQGHHRDPPCCPPPARGRDLADQPQDTRPSPAPARRRRRSAPAWERRGTAQATGLIPPMVDLVRPARVVDEQVDGGADFLRRPPNSDAARLQRLREAVEHLPAVVGRLAPTTRRTRRERP